ncbi:hypothetical protein D3C72_1720450 [compost metagenome]
MPRRRQQRQVQADDVGLGQQRGAIDIAEAELIGQQPVLRHVVGQHAHAEAAGDADRRLADAAGTDHAEGLAVQVEADQPVQ